MALFRPYRLHGVSLGTGLGVGQDPIQVLRLSAVLGNPLPHRFTRNLMTVHWAQFTLCSDSNTCEGSHRQNQPLGSRLAHRSVCFLLAPKTEGCRAGAHDIQGLIGHPVHEALHCILAPLACGETQGAIPCAILNLQPSLVAHSSLTHAP